jgi:CelD/BcsL family acetyltransferase involved in cellulose biosynthesis
LTATEHTVAAGRITSVRTVPFDALTDADLDAWHRLRAANPALDSPYFHPGFAAAVHAGRPVQVAVGRDQRGAVQALLPGHRDGAVLRPVGWPGADFQGPIRAPGTAFPALKLLTGGVKRFAFDHLLEPDPDFAPWFESSRPSPFVDTTGGMEGYLGRASKSGKDNMGQARRRTNKAEKQLGPIRFGADVIDEEALREVVRLKRAQYAATGAADYFAEPERVEMLTRLLHTRGTEFAGILSTVHAGPHLLAAHFGIRSGPVLHWWFPVYDPEYSALAPGWILLRELVAAAPQLGVGRIDFGRGDDEYKRRAKTGEVQVAQGVVSRSSAYRVVRRARNSVISAAKSSAFGPQLRSIARRLRALNR